MNMTTPLTLTAFLRTLPAYIWPHLPPGWNPLQVRQPWGGLIQFYERSPAIHYEVGRAWQQPGLEIGLHFEARDQAHNERRLQAVQRHLVEIKHILGPQIEAEPWDRGWTKVYEVYPSPVLDTVAQDAVGARVAAWIACLQPILRQLDG